MDKEIIDINIIKEWYLKVWEEFIEVDRDFETLRKRREKLTIKLGSLESLLAQDGSVNIDELKQSIKAATGINSAQVEQKALPDAIIEVLRNSMVPMHYSSILTTLEEKGYVVTGRDPRNTVLAYISRHKKHIAKAPEAGRGYYKLKD